MDYLPDLLRMVDGVPEHIARGAGHLTDRYERTLDEHTHEVIQMAASVAGKNAEIARLRERLSQIESMASESAEAAQ